MKKLTHAEAKKRPENFPIIAKMLEEGKEFELAAGGRMRFVPPPKELLVKIAKGDQKTYNSIRLVPLTGAGVFSLSQIGKTPAFGGKTTDGTQHEDAEILSLKGQLSEIKKKSGSAVVPIKVGNKIIEVFDVVSTKGTPKSDFNFVDLNGKPVIHISHKKGNSPKHFQQWGGVTKAAGSRVSENKEVLTFLKDLKNIVGTEMKQGIGAFYRKVNPKSDLALSSIYGVRHDDSDWSDPNNVRVLVQGSVKLMKTGNSYAIRSNHTMTNPEPVSLPYDTIIMATYKGDGRTNGGIKNCRVGVYPTLDRKATEI